MYIVFIVSGLNSLYIYWICLLQTIYNAYKPGISVFVFFASSSSVFSYLMQLALRSKINIVRNTVYTIYCYACVIYCYATNH